MNSILVGTSSVALFSILDAFVHNMQLYLVKNVTLDVNLLWTLVIDLSIVSKFEDLIQISAKQ